MPRSFALKLNRSSKRSFPAAGEVLIFVMLVIATALAFSARLHAQGPALTTISEVRYTDAGWGVGYSGNLIGRFTSSSFSLTRYSRGQSYFLKSYDGSSPPKYSRYSTSLYVDYPL